MPANLVTMMLLAGCHGDAAENPFDDWGPYKNCEQDIVYTDYDEYDPNAGPYPGGEIVNVYTEQGGLLQSDEYVDNLWHGTHTLSYTTVCSYDESTHAPLGCETSNVTGKQPLLYSTETYAYRADGLLAWQSLSAPDWWIYVWTVTRDASDRVVRIEVEHAPTDKKGDGEVAGIPYAWDVWIYDDASSALTTYDIASAIPSEIDSYEYDYEGREYLAGVVHYTADNHQIVHKEYATPDGDVYEVHDYTYDRDHHLLTDVRDGGWETYTLTWDGDRLMTETREVAWKDLSDVRTDYTAEATYDCEAP